ncbi:hypothetical protein ABOZ73_07925 [Caulobacter sp. 73W]|uniref:Polysaccharide biosynthesis protein n=1 Tax=Caulobacter sp. 73W TaxID=3161137 RepID=A0AB39KYR3_9CAUL
MKIQSIAVRLVALFATLNPGQRARLFRGTVVNVLSQCVTAVLALVSLPILLAMWGTAQFGLWILISAFPAYLAMSDLGFGWAAAAKIAHAIGRGDVAVARRVHQTLLALNACCVAVFALLAVCIVMLGGGVLLPNNGEGELLGLKTALLLLCWTALVSLSMSSLTTAWRASGAYASTVVFNDAIRISEASLVMIVALKGGGILAAAACTFATRATGLGILLLLTPKVASWVRLSFRGFSLEEVRLLWRPALGALMLPLAFALNVQGMAIVVGLYLGVVPLAAFSAVRTVTRLVIQVMGVVSNAIVPEIGRAIGSSEQASTKVIALGAMAISGALGATFVIGSAIFGPWVVKIYTHQMVAASTLIMSVYAAAAVLQGIWNTGSNVLLGANRQSDVAYWIAGMSAVGIAAVYALRDRLSLETVGLVMCLTEIAILGVVLRTLSRFLTKASRA